jgi:hypothetical protein
MKRCFKENFSNRLASRCPERHPEVFGYPQSRESRGRPCWRALYSATFAGPDCVSAVFGEYSDRIGSLRKCHANEGMATGRMSVLNTEHQWSVDSSSDCRVDPDEFRGAIRGVCGSNQTGLRWRPRTFRTGHGIHSRRGNPERTGAITQLPTHPVDPSKWLRHARQRPACDRSTALASRRSSRSIRNLIAGRRRGSTENTRVVGETTQVMPTIQADYRLLRNLAAHVNLAYDRSVGRSLLKASFLEYQTALVWRPGARFTPVVEFAGGTDAIRVRTQLITCRKSFCVSGPPRVEGQPSTRPGFYDAPGWHPYSARYIVGNAGLKGVYQRFMPSQSPAGVQFRGALYETGFNRQSK